MYRGVAMVSVHHAMPFGATASVVAWHKVGGLIQSIARRLLHIPVFRYVDDYFTPERCVHLISVSINTFHEFD